MEVHLDNVKEYENKTYPGHCGTGFLWGASPPQVIINDYVIFDSDEIEGATVTFDHDDDDGVSFPIKEALLSALCTAHSDDRTKLDFSVPELNPETEHGLGFLKDHVLEHDLIINDKKSKEEHVSILKALPQPLVMISHPHGLGKRLREGSVSAFCSVSYVRHTLGTNPGSSGGNVLYYSEWKAAFVHKKSFPGQNMFKKAMRNSWSSFKKLKATSEISNRERQSRHERIFYIPHLFSILHLRITLRGCPIPLSLSCTHHVSAFCALARPSALSLLECISQNKHFYKKHLVLEKDRGDGGQRCPFMLPRRTISMRVQSSPARLSFFKITSPDVEKTLSAGTEVAGPARYFGTRGNICRNLFLGNMCRNLFLGNMCGNLFLGNMCGNLFLGNMWGNLFLGNMCGNLFLGNM